MAAAGDPIDLATLLRRTGTIAGRVDAAVTKILAGWIAVALGLSGLGLVGVGTPLGTDNLAAGPIVLLAGLGLAGFVFYWVAGFFLLRRYLARFQPQRMGPPTLAAFAGYFGRVVVLLLAAGLAAGVIGLIFGLPAAGLAPARPSLALGVGGIGLALGTLAATFIYVRLIPWFAGPARNGAAAPPPVAQHWRSAGKLVLAAVLVFALVGAAGIALTRGAGLLELESARLAAAILASLVSLVGIHAYEVAVVVETDRDEAIARGGAANDGAIASA